MVVHSRRRHRPRTGDAAPVDLDRLDLGHAGLFLGLRMNALVIERGFRAGFRGLRESHGYVVQHLIEDERTISEIGERMRVSQQAASKAIAELVALGYVEVEPADDRRQRCVRLSDRGWAAVRFARRTRRHIEARLRKAAGSSQYDDAKRIVLTCLDALGGLGAVRSRRVREPR